MTTEPVTAVHLTAPAARVITSELCTADHTLETGGILLGHHARDTVTVQHAGTPGPAAVRTPTYFLRDLAHAQALASVAFAADRSVWVGEWHTHPTGRPVPSARDTATYRGLLDDPELGFHSVIAVIFAAQQGRWTGVAWTCHSGRITPARLTISSMDGPP
ncbi:Mov34/MPN/PAD-1 family protein [Streptomyces sp. Go40/10]|uniref:Mov34/MPN/PAD-1 family protein n=1 Tax=Streptomyces sp. Go40/10 TaxID=2825844 RepID=UPI001E5DB92B|nr:Mov34/MPN/PAD-1 family protein [Streptomyces sp. Go40/10]UFQ99826.1 Mov34/MPN/PAD-1 family protein [Streptomyces sp. Go40/10]